MSSRDSSLKAIRLDLISNTIKTDMSSEEYFQNSVLRPLIKFQNDLLIAAFLNFSNKYKNVFFELSTEKKITYIENALLKDSTFRNCLKDMIVGLFTVEEYNVYTLNASALNKRMVGIIKERLISHIQLLTEMGPTE
ncbi:glyoxalase [Flavobacteriaceae bacterium]|jgi:hypothetical protein|nr:glyoxalase [Flavobacteriaceae bacterium]MDA7724246.1 glyoxalase [Flavobacteriaceae bacterium]MDA7728246.1 glyoxalase [Flavobacteriaceae bacterium]